jgi:hypothetical protein
MDRINKFKVGDEVFAFLTDMHGCQYSIPSISLLSICAWIIKEHILVNGEWLGGLRLDRKDEFLKDRLCATSDVFYSKNEAIRAMINRLREL